MNPRGRRAPRPRVALAFACLACAALAACPAPPIDDNEFGYDIVPRDAVPADPPLRNPSGPPSCAPEGIVDANATGQRSGATLRVRVDTRGRRNDVRVGCVPYDSSEVVLRYTTPPLAVRNVRALRVTTLTEPTLPVGAPLDAGGAPATDDRAGDPTEYDTVLALRLTCDGREVECNNDAFFRDPAGVTRTTRRSEIYHVEPGPEETLFIVVDGFDGSAGAAVVTIEEITTLGVLGAPCVPIPPQRALDPTADTDYFRCPHDGIQCRPGAAPDGTDLCLPLVPLGGTCDPHQRFDVCARTDQGVECASNPAAGADPARCALPGTAPGSRCRGVRGTPNRCDGPNLACAEGGPMADRDECVVVRQLGGSCDPSMYGAIDRCADGLSCCAPSADAGSAVCVTAESAARACFRPTD